MFDDEIEMRFQKEGRSRCGNEEAKSGGSRSAPRTWGCRISRSWPPARTSDRSAFLCNFLATSCRSGLKPTVHLICRRRRPVNRRPTSYLPASSSLGGEIRCFPPVPLRRFVTSGADGVATPRCQRLTWMTWAILETEGPPRDPRRKSPSTAHRVRAFGHCPRRWQSVLWYRGGGWIHTRGRPDPRLTAANSVAALAYRAARGLRKGLAAGACLGSQHLERPSANGRSSASATSAKWPHRQERTQCQ
jgi:hypothetical protein